MSIKYRQAAGVVAQTLLLLFCVDGEQAVNSRSHI